MLKLLTFLFMVTFHLAKTENKTKKNEPLKYPPWLGLLDGGSND